MWSVEEQQNMVQRLRCFLAIKIRAGVLFAAALALALQLYGGVMQPLPANATATMAASYNFDTYEGGATWADQADWAFYGTSAYTGETTTSCGVAPNCVKFDDDGDAATYVLPEDREFVSLGFTLKKNGTTSTFQLEALNSKGEVIGEVQVYTEGDTYADLPLPVEARSVRFSLHKLSGNFSLDDVVVETRMRAPMLEFTKKPVAMTNSNFEVAVTAKDASGLDEAGFSIKASDPESNTQVDVCAPETLRIELNTDKTEATLTCTVDVSLLKDSLRYSLIIQATDRTGAVGRVALPFTVDRVAPVVSFAGYQGVNTTPLLMGGSDENVVLISIDGGVPKEVAVEDGAWQYQVVTPLTVGTHTIEVTATDEAGNMASTTRFVDGQSISAVLTVVAPVITVPFEPLPEAPTLIVQPVADVSPVTVFRANIVGSAIRPEVSPPDTSQTKEQQMIDVSKMLQDSERPAVISPSTQGWKIIGIAWYWWFLGVAAFVGGVIMYRRRIKG